MACLIGGLLVGLVVSVAWETIVVFMATSLVAAVILYMYAPQLRAVPMVTFLISLGMYFSTTL